VELSDKKKLILVTGATGYVGARLVFALLEKGYRVRASGRSLAKLRSRPWADHPDVELVPADILDAGSLQRVLNGARAAYYLVHSMLPGQEDFTETDRRAAGNMARAASEAGLEQIIYLSGLGQDSPDLSRHLKSRTETGNILRQGKTPVTILRAAMIIGAGSASFEILRYLVERLPVMIAPRWVRTPCQPIAIRNVVSYLSGVLEKLEAVGATYDVGGSDVVTYQDLMRIYAEEAGLKKRIVIPVPVLTPRLSSYWIHLVTPVPASLARPLAEGLRNPVVCRDHRIRELIPQKLLDCRGAVREALQETEAGQIVSRWTDAGKMPSAALIYSGDPSWSGGTVFRERNTVCISADVSKIWSAISAIGGRRGWYYADWLWRLRGWMDRLAGGIGFRGGRQHDQRIREGDALDFWRVLVVEKDKRLLLTAEMKLPGKAFLEFEIVKQDDQLCELKQTAVFHPRGLLGICYWYLTLPFHRIIFSGMLRAIRGSILRGR
jgi:uncharacterized protein YbjT (DUF2867 family)